MIALYYLLVVVTQIQYFFSLNFYNDKGICTNEYNVSYMLVRTYTLSVFYLYLYYLLCVA